MSAPKLAWNFNKEREEGSGPTVPGGWLDELSTFEDDFEPVLRFEQERFLRSTISQWTEYYNRSGKYYILSCIQDIVQNLRAVENEENVHSEWPCHKSLWIVLDIS